MQRTYPRYGAGLIGAFLLLSVFFVTTATSQTVRPTKSVFLRPSFGFVNYVGDNNTDLSQLGIKGQFEVGYQITPELAIASLYNFGEYTTALRPDPATGLDRIGGNTRLSSVQALMRFVFGKKTAAVAPYMQAGVGVAFGGDQADDSPGWGPVGGLGFDVLISPTTLFFIEANTHFTVPDEAIDGPDRGLFASHDLLSGISLGMQFNLAKKAFIPVKISNVETPVELEVDELGSFVADGNMGRATDPVFYNWDFGDGTSSPLQRASHSYEQPGTYTVTFNAGNDGSADLATRTVIVVPKEAPAEIVAMNSFPNAPDTRTEVTFDANIVGNQPYQYLWTFGDGGSSTDPNPRHTYSEPGRYNVELSVVNGSGSDNKSMVVIVDRVEASYCKELTELNVVYYGKHSSILSPTARDILQDNLQILRECPNMTVRVEGYAVPGEQDPDRLAADRARAVEEFYVDNGVTFSRVYSEGKGMVRSVGRLKDGMELFRRAESVIVDL
ncbi:MAG: OmpA family protein [Rhodothermales bacterium]